MYKNLLKQADDWAQTLRGAAEWMLLIVSGVLSITGFFALYYDAITSYRCWGRSIQVNVNLSQGDATVIAWVLVVLLSGLQIGYHFLSLTDNKVARMKAARVTAWVAFGLDSVMDFVQLLPEHPQFPLGYLWPFVIVFVFFGALSETNITLSTAIFLKLAKDKLGDFGNWYAIEDDDKPGKKSPQRQPQQRSFGEVQR